MFEICCHSEINWAALQLTLADADGVDSSSTIHPERLERDLNGVLHGASLLAALHPPDILNADPALPGKVNVRLDELCQLFLPHDGADG